MNWLSNLWNSIFKKKSNPPAIPPVQPAPVKTSPSLPIPAGTRASVPHMVWLLKNLGQKQVTGQPMDAFEQDTFKHTSYTPPNNIEAAACAATECDAIESTGGKSPHDASAISFYDFAIAIWRAVMVKGMPQSYITASKFFAITLYGDVCVLMFGTDHHVSNYYGPDPKNPNNALFLGGNQNHELCIASYPIANVIAINRLPAKD